MFIKNDKIKAVYCHRNAQLEGLGKRVVRMLRYFDREELDALFDYLIPVDEDTPIETKMLSNTIEGAQRKIEGRNFGIRKNVLQYDDV